MKDEKTFIRLAGNPGRGLNAETQKDAEKWQGAKDER